MALLTTKVMTNTSPAAASTTIGATTITGLATYDWFELSAVLTGATGGTLDVYLQREVVTDVWEDWVHFTQIGIAAAATRVHVPTDGASVSGITTIGGGSTAAPGVALAAGVALGGHPGNTLRMVFVAGAGTSAGAAQVVCIMCHKSGGG